LHFIHTGYCLSNEIAVVWGRRKKPLKLPNRFGYIDQRVQHIEEVGDMGRPVILSAVRTAIGRFNGTLAPLPATALGAETIKQAIKRAGIDADSVDEVIMGNVVGAGAGQAPARQAAIHGGVPASAGALTINKVCGSGLKAVMLAAQGILLDDVSMVVAGGMESMSNAPYMLPKARTGYRMGNGELVDLMIHDGLWDSFNNIHMGLAGEYVADKFSIGREAQDEYAANSHIKAIAAIEGGKFKEEITPIEIPQRKGDPIVFDTDESPRAGTTAAGLAKLRPAFKKDGSVTAGNAPPVNDGASSLVVTSEEKANELGIAPMARIVGYAVSGVDPKELLIAPVTAVQKLLAKIGWKKEEVDLYELNEAFSVQALACCSEIGIGLDNVNVNGGAVALGHPIGASGARVLTTLLYAMADRNVKKGVAALCLGGGNAVAMAVERF
jgi:acetyl-CoA C-acetyltransferase